MHHYIMLPHSATEPGKPLSFVTGLRNKTCLKMYKKEVHFILQMVLSKDKEKTLGMTPSTWPQEGAQVPQGSLKDSGCVWH